MYYVYILKLTNKRTYTGCTSNLKKRIVRHNKGLVISTRDHLPVKLIFYCGFIDKYTAYKFEKYLKSGNGRIFINKRLI